jgi:hypothetical protein
VRPIALTAAVRPPEKFSLTRGEELDRDAFVQLDGLVKVLDSHVLVV